MAFVDDAKLVTVDGSLTGPIASGHITVRGPLINDREHARLSYYDEKDTMLQTNEATWLIMFAHYNDQLIWGLGLRRIKSWSHYGCYQHVGAFNGSCGTYCERYAQLSNERVTII